MSDTRKIIPELEETLGDIWEEVTGSFDSEHSAAKWLVRPLEVFNNNTPLSFLQGNKEQVSTVHAVLEKFDGIRIG